MGKNPVVAVIAVIILIVAVVLIVRGMSDPSRGPVGQGTWYDTGSGEVYGGPNGVLPPAPAPSGKDGVMAAVYSTSTCENKADRYIAYLMKYTEEGKPLVKAAQDDKPIDTVKMTSLMGEHRLVRRENDTEWVAFGTEEGQAILAEVKQTGGRMCPKHIE